MTITKISLHYILNKTCSNITKKVGQNKRKNQQLSENDRLVYSPDALRYKAVFWRKETQKIEMKAGVCHYNNTKNEIALSA